MESGGGGGGGGGGAVNEIHLSHIMSQDLQFDIKHGYLSRLTPNNPNGGQRQDETTRFKKTIKSYFLTKISDLIPDMAINIG